MSEMSPPGQSERMNQRHLMTTSTSQCNRLINQNKFHNLQLDGNQLLKPASSTYSTSGAVVITVSGVMNRNMELETCNNRA